MHQSRSGVDTLRTYVSRTAATSVLGRHLDCIWDVYHIGVPVPAKLWRCPLRWGMLGDCALCVTLLVCCQPGDPRGRAAMQAGMASNDCISPCLRACFASSPSEMGWCSGGHHRPVARQRVDRPEEAAILGMHAIRSSHAMHGMDLDDMGDDPDLARAMQASLADDVHLFPRAVADDEADVAAIAFFKNGGIHVQAVPDHVAAYNSLAANVIVVTQDCSLFSWCTCPSHGFVATTPRPLKNRPLFRLFYGRLVWSDSC
jgi:hypothetical protein